MEREYCRQKLLIIAEQESPIAALIPEFQHLYSVFFVHSENDVLSRSHEGIAVIIAEQKALGESGVNLLQQYMKVSPNTLWILIVDKGLPAFAENAFEKNQVYAYLSSPFESQTLLILVRRAIEHFVLVTKYNALCQQFNRAHISSYPLLYSVQNDKMLKLGKMMAEIIHEINTPSGAINAASVNINHHLQLLIESFWDLEKQNLSPENIERIMKIISTMASVLTDNYRRTSGEVRLEQKKIVEVLKREGFHNSRSLGKQIARMNLGGDFEVLLALIKRYDENMILSFLTHCQRIINSARDINVSIELLTRMLRALKSYLHPKQEKPEPVNVNESIETALIILSNKLKHRIHVEWRQDENIPNILGYASELSHVWINLLHNAIQAIDGEGEIRIETDITATALQVKITDNGPGIPADVEEQIFDVNFTTKSQGEGTGLGLYISRQIIEKHRGTITVTSKPSKTTFIIHLPLSLPGSESVKD